MCSPYTPHTNNERLWESYGTKWCHKLTFLWLRLIPNLLNTFVGPLSRPVSNVKPTKNRGFGHNFEIIVFTSFLVLVATVTDVSWSDRATMTNVFATISGVFLGLYFVIKSRKNQRDSYAVFLLLLSIIVSLISSLLSFDQKNSPFTSKYILWLLSAFVFGLSTAYFAIKTEMLE